MTGKELKELIAEVPDDAEVEIAGADSGGYDITWCQMAHCDLNPATGVYELTGVADD
jgi:hypothetical protein